MQVNTNSFVMASPFGKIGLVLRDDAICQLNWLPSHTALQNPESTYAATVITELNTYFQAPQHLFRIKLALTGTSFQLRVWEALQHIPSGTTVTYKELAKKLGSSPRAIGQACRTNPIPLIIPCHRVIAAKGLGGYTGATEGPIFATKRQLLEHEGWKQDISHSLAL